MRATSVFKGFAHPVFPPPPAIDRHYPWRGFGHLFDEVEVLPLHRKKTERLNSLLLRACMQRRADLSMVRCQKERPGIDEPTNVQRVHDYGNAWRKPLLLPKMGMSVSVYATGTMVKFELSYQPQQQWVPLGLLVRERDGLDKWIACGECDLLSCELGEGHGWESRRIKKRR
jgi:hypothetical protein